MTDQRDQLIATARKAQAGAYAPYSKFHVGAALLFADGSVVSGANVENASYGLALCAETSAVASAMNQGLRGGRTVRWRTLRAAMRGPIEARSSSRLGHRAACHSPRSDARPH